MKIFRLGKLIFLCGAILLPTLLVARDSEWLLKTHKRLDEIEGWKRIDKLDELGQFVGGLTSGNLNDNKNEIYKRTRLMILETPEYANYYRNDLVEWNKIAIKDGAAWSDFVVKRAKVVRTLAVLQTPESVEALAGLLDCDETRNVPMEGGPLSQLAASALSGMIENPPAKFNPIPWREWRERVASGKQTFQFKGSPVRYNFEGPVAEAAQPQPAARTQLHGTPADLPVASSTAVQPPRDWPMKVGLGLALVVIVVFGCVKWRARDRRRN
jgi:hypothetical protein